ncbi:MAG: hypothetical protein LBT05_01685 [Planctomycetaceae bacterium]|jgi:hypothetical protein|nr:hypothetical protein [Planctomycetaceae bacterium]
MKYQSLNLRYFATLKNFVLFMALTVCFCNFTHASDFTDWLLGGRGSRTTVSQPYIPPVVTTPEIIPVADSYPQTVAPPSNGVTLPPGGTVVANGVASTGYISTNQPTIWNGLPRTTLPTAAVPPVQPTVEYEWSYSTIKDTTYDPITVYDSSVGGYVTSYRERQTESVLPWLHRKQVIRYKPITGTEKSNRPIVGALNNVISNITPQENLPASALPTYATPATTILPTISYPVVSSTAQTNIVSPGSNPASFLPTQIAPAAYISTVSPTVSVQPSIADIPPTLPPVSLKNSSSISGIPIVSTTPNSPTSETKLRPVQTSEFTQLPAIVSPSQYHTANPSATTPAVPSSDSLPATQSPPVNSKKFSDSPKLNLPNTPSPPLRDSDALPNTTAKPLKRSPFTIYPLQKELK